MINSTVRPQEGSGSQAYEPHGESAVAPADALPAAALPAVVMRTEGGLAAFALCLCWELPTVLQTLVQEGGGALLTPTLLFRLGLCCVGALGALSAVRCTRTEQDA